MSDVGRDEQRRRPILLDGRRLARERAPGLADRARRVASRRGVPPRLALVAFERPDGQTPFLTRKLRACREAGVEARVRVLPAGAGTDEARSAVEELLGEGPLDGLFLEFPFPPGVDEDAVLDLVPPELDLDVMTRERIQRYLMDGEGPPPLTVEAVLLLLDRYGVEIDGLDGVVVAEPSPFTRMLHTALARRGARMQPLLSPDAPDLEQRIAHAELVVAAAMAPGIIRAERLAEGAIAIDVGYFNPGGRGDIDTSGGATHLAALAPVPGALGPMTVSVMVERVTREAEDKG